MKDLTGYRVHYNPGAFRRKSGELIRDPEEFRDLVAKFRALYEGLNQGMSAIVVVEEIGTAIDGSSGGEGLAADLFVVVVDPSSDIIDTIGRFETFVLGHYAINVDRYSRSIDGRYTQRP